jgi:hypothetical protein
MTPVISVVFFFAVLLPDHPPFRDAEPMPSLVACLTAQMEFLTRAQQRALVDGRKFSAGCSVEVARSMEH